MAEVVTLREAVAELVHDGDTVALEGFTHLIPHAAGHEVIRQGRRDLTLIRLTPDVVYDQLIGMGCAAQARVLVGREPGRRVAAPVPRRRRARLAGAARDRGALACRHGRRLRGGRANLPFGVLRGYAGTDLPQHTPRSRRIDVPVHGRAARRGAGASGPTSASSTRSRPTGRGNVQLWGIIGVQKEAVLASRRSIVTVEEVVDELEPRPGAVVLPSWSIDGRGGGPGGAHPSYAHGYYDRDNDFYVRWDAISRDRDTFRPG